MKEARIRALIPSLGTESVRKIYYRNEGSPYKGIDTLTSCDSCLPAESIEMKEARIRALIPIVAKRLNFQPVYRNEGSPYKGIDTSKRVTVTRIHCIEMKEARIRALIH